MDSGAFPVGFVKLNYYPSIIVNGFNTNFMTNTVLGFQTSQSDSVNGFIMASSLWGICNDLAIYLYFPNVPHNNTHFGTLLMSFKIPISAGYQAIEFTAESQNFSQYIEVSDNHFILNSLKIAIYDTQGQPILNQYNFNFTLGFET